MINRLILYRGGSCNELRVLAGLKQLNTEVYVLEKKCENYDVDAALAEALFALIHGKRAEAILSVDYYPIIAEVAKVAGIPYLAWIIDAPHYTLYSSTTLYDSTYIFHFDREEAERLVKMGRPNVFHQPLASDPDFFGACIAGQKKKNTAEISFLGSSYQNEHDYFEKKNGLSDYLLGYCEGLMNAQHEIYGASVIAEALDERAAEELLKACDIHMPETYDIPVRLVAGTILEKKLSVRERKRMVRLIGERYGITLYSDSEKMVTKGVKYAGYADYETQMAPAFYHSRININHTLRQIHSGIPLRVLDIMASGGFLLSNWQQELAEHFTDGESLALYGSEEEMLEKAGWYLEHEEVRKRIADKGREQIIAEHTYKKVLCRMLKGI